MIEERFSNAFSLHEAYMNDSEINEGGNYDEEKTRLVKELIDSNSNWDINDYDNFLVSLSKSKYPCFLTKYTKDELEQANVTTYKLHGYNIGYALKPMEDGNVDIISVHNNENGVKGVVDDLLTTAKINGGTQLDHFDGELSQMYQRNGFDEYDRMKFDDNYAPANCDYTRFQRPDVIMRRLNKHLKECLSMLNRMYIA